MKVLLLIALLSVCVLAERNYRSEFSMWAKKHEKTYSAVELHHRFNVWRKNLALIESHNAKGMTYTLGMNHFGDLTPTEFKKFFLGFRMNVSNVGSPSEIIRANPAAPASIDWVKKGAVTGVKNQGQCGSCWSFSSTGGIEGCHQIKHNALVSLSEQNLMDCSTSEGNQGCNGGLMTQAFDYVIKNKGIDTEASYKYTAKDGSCHYKAANSGATLSGYSNVQSGSESALVNAIVNGPVSVAIDASHSSFQFYSSGVYNEPACSSTALDHGVLAVGYGKDSQSGADFYLVKNSWGTSWGMSGYIEMSRNKNNQCGIASMATIANKC